jgi:hypothetical protein
MSANLEIVERMRNVRTQMEVTIVNVHLASITMIQNHAKVGIIAMKSWVLDRYYAR